MSEEIKDLAILVGIANKEQNIEECYLSLEELSRLADTAGAKTYAKIVQHKETYDPRTLIGSGKVKEIAELVSTSGANLVIFDEELTPAQIRNLENDIENVTVIDRSMLILDIFALHATSGEGKLQVELAQLKYSAPRLTGKGIDLSRQGGGIGSRGPGESKLETDRRHLHEKIVSLEGKLRELENNRLTMRSQRDKSGLPKIAIVGYTNAGKSTLLNELTGANVLSENKLFATLDPTTRKMKLPSGEEILLTDTVGFIRKLPHHLVKAFKSTLDEVKYADILLIILDASDPECESQLKVTEEVITDLGAQGKPCVFVYNKCDLVENIFDVISNTGAVFISAHSGNGIDELILKMETLIKENKSELDILIPYSEQSVVNAIYNEYSVLESNYTEDGVHLKVMLDSRGAGLYKKYIV